MDGYLESCDSLNARQFRIAIKRLADSLSYGTDRSPFLGAGIEYVQSRPYAWGDPIRQIDWRVVARTKKLFVKEYEAPKRMPCQILLDTSASMVISSGKRSKYAIALHIAGGVALACLDRISPVGVLGVGSRHVRVDPTLSRHQVLRWLHEFRRFRYDETTHLGHRIMELVPTLRHRALVVVLSDLHDPTAIGALKLMAQKHDCVVLQLRDPAERGLRGGGILRAQEAETGFAFVTPSRHPWLDQSSIEQQLKRGGVDHLVIDTDRPFVAALRGFFKSRDLLGRGAR